MSARIILANATYEEEKTKAAAANTHQRITIRLIERRLGLKAGQLISWRANEGRRAGSKHPPTFHPLTC